MPFSNEPEPARGIATAVASGIRRIVASNAGIMTCHGTNTYLVETWDGTAVIDPGPDEPAHVQAILAATGGKVAAILLTHTHSDHRGAVRQLQACTGAKTYAFALSAEPSFEPDVPLADGDSAAGMVCLHTPGHASDHLCFALPGELIFSGDHVMSWSSSIVSPPGGNMADYFRSLRRLIARDDRLLLPGHGPPMASPAAFIQSLLDHRVSRENAIAAALRNGPRQPSELVAMLYSKTHPSLIRAAEHNVLAHLFKLASEGSVIKEGELWRRT